MSTIPAAYQVGADYLEHFFGVNSEIAEFMLEQLLDSAYSETPLDCIPFAVCAEFESIAKNELQKKWQETPSPPQDSGAGDEY